MIKYKENEISKDSPLEAYQKYYYGYRGKLAKRRNPLITSNKRVKFGGETSKFGYQQRPLEGYLYTGIELDASVHSSESELDLRSVKREQKQTSQPLQSLDTFNEKSMVINRDYSMFDDEFTGYRVVLVLLDSHNATRISKRLSLSQSQNFKFRFEHSVQYILPSKVSFDYLFHIFQIHKDKIMMHKQFSEFLESATKLLKQNKTMHHAYTIEGKPIFSLCDIENMILNGPANRGDSKAKFTPHIFLSHSPFVNKVVYETEGV